MLLFHHLFAFNVLWFINFKLHICKGVAVYALYQVEEVVIYSNVSKSSNDK